MLKTLKDALRLLVVGWIGFIPIWIVMPKEQRVWLFIIVAVWLLLSGVWLGLYLGLRRKNAF